MARSSEEWDGPPPQMSTQVAFPRLTPVTKALLIANIGLYLVSLVLILANQALYLRVLNHLALSPSQWRESFPFVPAWQLLSYGLLHNVPDPMHVLGNMLMLYFFGTMLEELLGPRPFLLTYALAQLAGAVLFLIAGIALGQDTPAYGASGAVYGVMIAVATLRPRQTVFLLFIPITLRVMALFIVGITLIHALVTVIKPELGNDGTAHLVHLGGIAWGFVAAKTGLARADPVQKIERRRAVAEVERAAADDQRMDELLGKIHREGMAALSRDEKEFLKRVSSRK
jgi:membrane associated rhomboid family serine protease